MKLVVWFSTVVVAAGVFAACAGDPAATTGAPGGGRAATGAGGSATTPSGLPCEVATVLAAKCTSCHGDPPRSSAPQTLLTREQLLAPSEIDPGATYAQRSVLRMRAGAMPPGGGAQADADALDAWLAAGAPPGDCGVGEPGGADPFATPSECVSGSTWHGEEGREMDPGMACNACHRRSAEHGEEDELPIYVVAGTVYPNGHSPNRCFGIDGTTAPYAGIEVWITDARGADYQLDVGRSGNFTLRSAPGFTLPYAAKVVDTTSSPRAERVMATAETEGDCNLCHTENGGGDDSEAPGRILVP